MYSYSPLQSDSSVRLLRLHGSPDESSTLECTLFEVSLEDKNEEPYEAISYAWEGQKPTRIIRCSGKDILVTENCEELLRHFRPKDAGESRILWIDAICINQSESAIEERNHQVKLMGLVYSRALHVLAWLGSERKYPAALGHIQLLYHISAATTREDLARTCHGALITDIILFRDSMYYIHFPELNLGATSMWTALHSCYASKQTYCAYYNIFFSLSKLFQ